MINKKKLWFLIAALILLTNGWIVFLGDETEGDQCILEYSIHADKLLLLETYYSSSEEMSPSQASAVQMEQESQTGSFPIANTSQYLRMDLGTEGAALQLSHFRIQYGKDQVEISPGEILVRTVSQQDIEEIWQTGDRLEIRTKGEDPYLLLDVSSLHLESWANGLKGLRVKKEKAAICILLDLILILMGRFAVRLFIIPGDILINRRLVLNLAKNDFRTKYAGSFFGVFWAFVQPIVTIVLYWFVFQVGLGAGDVDGHPFVLWLVAGLVPWMFFQDAVLYGTNALMEYSFLVKKVVFNISILPVVKVLSAFIVHVFFLMIMALLFTAMGAFPGIQIIQVLYYSVCAGALAIGLVYASSAVVLFFRDLSQIINIILQVGTWMTPIMWQITNLPEGLRWLFKLNPMYYVVQGYRDALLEGVWFFERLGDTAYFWVAVLALYAVGVLIFQKLKPHFADVL